jgi:group I intron endonuclease
VYIGSSSNIERRWKNHRKALEESRHHCQKLQTAWRRSGKDRFEFGIIEECTQEVLLEREQYWLDYYVDIRYNTNPIAMSRYGGKHTEETKQKLRLLRIGKPLSEQHKKAISDAQRNTKKSEEWKAKIAESNRKRWSEGSRKPRIMPKRKPLTEEHKRILSEKSKAARARKFWSTKKGDASMKPEPLLP